ncbi:MAG: asparagine synthase (glutamine-hydrolyzing), partial [Nanoarchaeota archaeon]
MCGIVGFSGFEDTKLLQEMTSLLSHRGPDQSGSYTDEFVSLGHRRLSIIDLSEDGKQPMSNEDDTIWIVFNGEIYNYKELRVKLEERKHTFKSKTDTEVIIHAYEEYGEKCVELFNGDFAFAIYDVNKKSLFMARDRLGIKPLYYTVVDGHFYFASEIKAILSSPEVKRKVNVQALNFYLTFFANPLAETMFQGIYKLLPGHTLRWEQGKVTIEKYWDLEMKPQKMSLSTAQEELQRLLRDSVEKRLMSDVPLGVYLSGGVDSGSVVSLMSTFSEKIKTFSVGFEGHSELSQAKITADYFNTDHTEMVLGTDAIKALPEVVWHQDEPMGDPTSIPTYFLSQEAKKNVTVVLTGEGADEQFAGYEQEKFMMLHQQYVRKLPAWMRKSMLLPLQKLPAQSLTPLFKYMGSLGEEGKRRLQEFVLANEPVEALMNIISLFTEEEKKKATAGKLGKEVQQHPVMNDVRSLYFTPVQKK